MTCIRCNDTKKYSGLGMMIVDCDLCDDYDDIGAIDRDSKSYKNAIKDIMAANKVSKSEAIKQFDDAYKKG